MIQDDQGLAWNGMDWHGLANFMYWLLTDWLTNGRTLLDVKSLSRLKSKVTNLSWRQFTDTSALFLFNCQSKTRPRSRDCRNSISFVVSDVRGVTVWMFLCWPGPITPSAISGSQIELKWQLIPDLEIPHSSDLVILGLNLCDHRYGSCSWRTWHYLL